MSNLHSQDVVSNAAVNPVRSHSLGAESVELAPIALFVYNRPEHTRRTVESLRANYLAPQSDLFVFADGAKNESAAAAVREVRKFIRTIDGFKSVTLIERDRNLGLANSVIAGITELCNKLGRVIAMEDDLLTTCDYLTFINQALERYEKEPRIFSVSGFNFGFSDSKYYPYDAFCFYRSSSWGWGTWKNRWEQADWNISDYDSFRIDKKRQRLFDRGGDDLSYMLALQMGGKIDSWAIRWAYTHFKQDALALLSFRPRVLNIGTDSSATHTRRKSAKQSPLTKECKSEFLYSDTLSLEKSFVLELQRSLRPSPARKLVRYLLHSRIGLTTNLANSWRIPKPKVVQSKAPEVKGSSNLD